MQGIRITVVVYSALRPKPGGAPVGKVPTSPANAAPALDAQQHPHPKPGLRRTRLPTIDAAIERQNKVDTRASGYTILTYPILYLLSYTILYYTIIPNYTILYCTVRYRTVLYLTIICYSSTILCNTKLYSTVIL